MEKISRAFVTSLQHIRAAYFGFMRAVRHFRLNMIGVLQGPDVPILNSTLPELFDKQFEKLDFGKKIAIIQGRKRITFLELKKNAETIARNLSEITVADGGLQGHPQNVLGLFTQPGDHRIAAILGLLKLNCAYLPLDFTLPSERMSVILQDSGVKFVICDDETTEAVLQKVIDTNPEITVINIQTLLQNQPENDLRTPATMRSVENPLVSVLYTSGSTGRPKGVPINTKNLLNRLSWQWDEIPFSSEDIGCHKTSMLFVDSLTEILSCLLKGIPLVILSKNQTMQPEPFIQAITSFQISRLVLVPSHLKMLIDNLMATKDLDKVFSIRAIISSGESLPFKTAQDFFTVFPLCSVLYNLYGSTETTGDITYMKFEGVEDLEDSSVDGVMSLGAPLYNTCVIILDDNGETCKEGTVGHVYISGQSIVQGYVNTTVRESQSFIPNSVFTKVGHGSLYQIGDLGTVKEGKLYFQGRSDEQVKVRGHRVDLHEIQQIVKLVKSVESCVVLPYKDTNGYVVPVVFYTGQQSKEDTEVKIKIECEKRLAKYAIPRCWKVDMFPFQPDTGKVDRQKLLHSYRDKVMSDTSNEMSSASITKSEKILKILAKNISVPRENIRSDLGFFENGGNSLSAVATVSNLCSEGINISLSDFLGLKTIADLLEFECTGKDSTPCALNSRYQPVMLNSVPNKEDAIHILSRGFSQKNPLDVLAGTSERSVERLVRSFWREILEDDLSTVVVDKQSLDIVAVSIALDLKTEVHPIFDKQEVGEINEMVEEPVRRKLIKNDGKWVDSVLAAVDSQLADDIALSVLEMMENYSFQVIQKRGYDGIFGVNSHPVTMMLAEQRFGFVTMNSLHVKSFCYQGRYPFKDAEDTYIIKAMVKHLK